MTDHAEMAVLPDADQQTMDAMGAMLDVLRAKCPPGAKVSARFDVGDIDVTLEVDAREPQNTEPRKPPASPVHRPPRPNRPALPDGWDIVLKEVDYGCGWELHLVVGSGKTFMHVNALDVLRGGEALADELPPLSAAAVDVLTDYHKVLRGPRDADLWTPHFVAELRWCRFMSFMDADRRRVRRELELALEAGAHQLELPAYFDSADAQPLVDSLTASGWQAELGARPGGALVLNFRL